MRYEVVEGSISSHCCFEATVIDTTIKPEYPASQVFCECFDTEAAQKIADALNAMDNIKEK